MYTEMVLLVVYVDILIFTNILINYCILSATKKYLHITTSEFRIILSSSIGGVFSVLALLPIQSNLISLTLKLIGVSIMCAVAFLKHNFRIYLKSMIASFIFSSMLCGIVILFEATLDPHDITIFNDTIYIDIDPMVLITISVAVYILIMLIKRILKADLINTIVNVKITVCGKEVSCIGKIDTACSVTEPFSGSPAIIAERSMFDCIESANRIIPYKSLNGSGILRAVKAEKLIIDNKVIPKDVYIGFFEGNIDPNFKVLINHNVLGD